MVQSTLVVRYCCQYGGIRGGANRTLKGTNDKKEKKKSQAIQTAVAYDSQITSFWKFERVEYECRVVISSLPTTCHRFSQNRLWWSVWKNANELHYQQLAAVKWRKKGTLFLFSLDSFRLSTIYPPPPPLHF